MLRAADDGRCCEGAVRAAVHRCRRVERFGEAVGDGDQFVQSRRARVGCMVRHRQAGFEQAPLRVVQVTGVPPEAAAVDLDEAHLAADHVQLVVRGRRGAVAQHGFDDDAVAQAAVARLYIGELTNCPGAGFERFMPRRYAAAFGAHWPSGPGGPG